MSGKRYVVGIDPGVSTGFAIYDRDTKQIKRTATYDFWSCYEWAAGIAKSESTRNKTLIVIETPKKFFLYGRHDGVTGEKVRNNMSAKAGGNGREAELLADGLERLGFEVRRVRPVKRKWTAEQLARYTGITTRTNAHVRDAISLCFGV